MNNETPPGRPGKSSNEAETHTRQPAVPADGLAARHLAATALYAVLDQRRSFDDAFQRAADTAKLAPRDRAFARAIATTVLRRRGEIKAVLCKFLEKPLPAKEGLLEAILLSAGAQLLFLKTPPHAAISLAVEQCRASFSTRRFDKLANAVLRRVSERGEEILAELDASELNIPAWLMARWRTAYGKDTARSIAEASLQEPPLDLSVKTDPALWAEKLGGIVLPTGSVRLTEAGRIEDIAGYDEGEWWVQDAAAALPAKILGDVTGLDIADLCAAPGGKTAQLANAGANVVAVELSPARAARLNANLARLKLPVETAISNVMTWAPGRLFDAVLLDAPCTATGTIRRHPDILHLKRAEDVASLAQSQAKMLDAAAKLVKPGGRLLYCTCSLEDDEGASQIARFLASRSDFKRIPIDIVSTGGESGWLTAAGDLRTLPSYFGALRPGQQGMDGFFVSLLARLP